MNYILLDWNFGRESMKMTVDAMTEPCELLLKRKSGEWYSYSPKTKEFSSLKSIMSILNGNNRIINWGNHIFRDNSLFDLNAPEAVSLASDKSRSRLVLQKAGVAVPHTWFYGEAAVFPFIARPSHHHGGNNFHVVNNAKEWDSLRNEVSNDWYFSEIFVKTHEFRIHCGHGKVLIVNEKPLIEGELRANQAVNHESWRALKWHEFNAKINQEALRAIEVLGLDYGAVDIMYNALTNSVAICEVNTSPSINTEYASGKYAAYFSWVIRHDFPEHFSPDGTSVFYNNILRDERS